jgi:hypothetical protein
MVTSLDDTRLGFPLSADDYAARRNFAIGSRRCNWITVTRAPDEQI